MAIRVAIVEDEKHYSNALKKIIDYDQDLTCVGQIFDGNDAIKKLKSLQPDVVLMDIKLPFVHGYDVISTLKHDMEHTHSLLCVPASRMMSIFSNL